MKSFKNFLTETVLLENRAWHQFVGQNAAKLLDRAGLTDSYARNARHTMDPAHGTPEHLTNWLSGKLGMENLTTEEGRWVLKHLHGGGIQRAEDIQSTVIPNLQRLRQAKSEGKSDASLAKIQGASALHAHLKKVYPASSESLEHLLSTEYTIHGENEHWTVVQPHTKDAACAVGKGTNWCTASTGHSMFDHYNEQAPIYTLIPKNPVRRGERYQLHVPQQNADNIQFMDETDRPVGDNQEWSPLSVPEKIPSRLSKKHVDRPLPEISDPHARAALHGVRDLYDFKTTENRKKQKEILDTRLAKGSESGTPDDMINAAMLNHAYAYSEVPVHSSHMRHALTKGGSESVHQARRHLDQMSQTDQREILDDATMEALQTHSNPQVRIIGAMKKWKPEHVMRAVTDPNATVARAAFPSFQPVLSSKLGPEHVTAGLAHPDPSVRRETALWAMNMHHHKLTREHMETLAADPSDTVQWAITHPEYGTKHLDPGHVHAILQSARPVNTQEQHNIIGRIHPMFSRREHAHSHSNSGFGGTTQKLGNTFSELITPAHITRALQNPDTYSREVRQTLLYHPQFDPAKHMELARQNPDLDLRKSKLFPFGHTSPTLGGVD